MRTICITKPFRFSERSDVDIGFVGLDNRHFFKVMSIRMSWMKES